MWEFIGVGGALIVTNIGVLIYVLGGLKEFQNYMKEFKAETDRRLTTNETSISRVQGDVANLKGRAGIA